MSIGAKVDDQFLWRTKEQDMDHMSFLKYMYRVRFSFTDGTEILYRCSMIKPKAKNRWKIACEDGTWVGTGLPCGKLYY